MRKGAAVAQQRLLSSAPESATRQASRSVGSCHHASRLAHRSLLGTSQPTWQQGIVGQGGVSIHRPNLLGILIIFIKHLLTSGLGWVGVGGVGCIGVGVVG